MGRTFSMLPGGKGANQAVQAARLGAEVTMFGKVGDDDFGKRLIASVEKSGVNTDHISITHAAPTAIGNVWIQNRRGHRKPYPGGSGGEYGHRAGRRGNLKGDHCGF